MKPVFRYLLMACVLSAAVLAVGAWGHAQALVATQSVDPVVLSGADVGFRMTGRKGDTPVGELVVRVDGKWKPVQFDLAMKPATR